MSYAGGQRAEMVTVLKFDCTDWSNSQRLDNVGLQFPGN
jgi:hypothetical protein